MSVSPEEIARIARLAELEVDQVELPGLSVELSRIVDFVGQLGTDEPAADGLAPSPARLRPDRVSRGDPMPLETFAPALREGFFVVPRLPAQDAE